MKKLICLLLLCLCLNGAIAAAEGDAPETVSASTQQASDETEAKRVGEAKKNPDSEPGTHKEAAPRGEAEPVQAVQGQPEGAPQGEAESGQAMQGQPEGAPRGEAESGQAVQGQPEGAPQGEAEPGQEAQGQPEGAPQGEAEPGQEAQNQTEGAPQGEAEPGREAEAGPGDAPQNEGEVRQEPAPSDETQAEPGQSPQDGAQAQSEPTDPAGVPENAEAWFESDGEKVGGRLADIIALLKGDEKVYLRSDKTLRVPEAPLKVLSGVTLLPDKQVFADGDCAVRVSFDDPREVEAPALIALSELSDRDDGERAALYVWVEAREKPGAEPEAEPTEAPAPVIGVEATGYHPAEWSAEAPVFTLSGIPEGAQYTYAAIIYDERIIPLSGDSWTAEQEGVYTVRFAMLDGIGDIVSASGKYTLWLDHTEPDIVIIMPDEEVSYTLHIIARDSVSGVAGVSLDGGATWTELTDDETYTYTSKHKQTFEEGSIMVADHAGNAYVFSGRITIDKVTPEPYHGGGGGGGSGKSTAAKTHASGDGEDTAQYDALTLELPDGPMSRLTVGGEAMDLTLTLESASGAHVGKSRTFTASLDRWGAPEGGSGAPDTLILSAEPDDGLGDEYVYEWRFNGEVYRMLANSDIKYVALRVGDDVVAFPTEGFTGGTKYTELKMLGVSTRRFDYTIDMRVNRRPGYVSAMSDSDFSQGCDLSIRAEVENMAYELSSSTGSIMYFYDVYLGPRDMLSQPFGKYRG